MNKPSRRVAALALCAALLSGVGTARAEQGTPAVRKAVTEFYRALNAMLAGDKEPMLALWSRRPDVTYMGPDGNIRHGWLEVAADFDAAAARKRGGTVEPKDITVTAGRDLAIVSDTEIGHRGGQSNSVRATSVFRLEDGRWRMIGHHVDPLPTGQK